ncbi:MAG: NAD(P)/FAD-dependent oxidoreductase [Aggregatilineales bacterium]
MPETKTIAIIGAGFAGLYAARTLAKSGHEVILIDRNNFHTFTPLLYQVATCGLDPASIAYPVRTIFRKYPNVHFLLGEVCDIDYDTKTLTIQRDSETRIQPYDYMLLATGSVTNHFGQEALEKYSFGLKDLDDAVRLRHHILKLFEKAAWTDDSGTKDALTTLVVVGGGPTGLETAGALYELYNYVLKREYTDRQPVLRARVILLEAADSLLLPYPEKLQKAAKKQLESLGVEVMLNAMVSDVSADKITLKDERVIHSHTMVWAAGVKASPLVDMLDVELARAGRIPIEPTIAVKERDSVYAAGDIAYLEDENGDPYPMLIPVAKQQGILAAQNMLHDIAGESPETFSYSDRGIMATVGRSRAVAWLFYKVQLTGFLAWLSWLFLHLLVLMGFRNRVSVFMSWIWNYLTYDRSVRIILENVDSNRLEEDVNNKVVTLT